MARSERWRRTARRAWGKGSSGSSPAWRRWRITTTFSRVGLLWRSSSSGNPCRRNSSRTWASPAAASLTITSSRSPKVCTSTIAPPRSSGSAAAGAAPCSSSRLRPSSRFSSAGLPRLSRRPCCTRAMRWQRSASTRSGVATTIVTPSSARVVSTSQKSRRDTGSTPVVGSSSSSNRGLSIRAQQRASFCFMPPESWLASRSAKGSRPRRRSRGPRRSRQSSGDTSRRPAT